MKKDNIEFDYKYHLSTDGYYFKYRKDNNNPTLVRATLYNHLDERVDDVAKSEGYGIPEKTHFGIIDYFEARLTLKQIP